MFLSPPSRRALLATLVFALLAGILRLVDPEQRHVLFPAPGLTVQPVTDSANGGQSWVHIAPDPARLAFVYGLRPGSAYPFAGVKLLPQGPCCLQTRHLRAIEIGMRSDSGTALRVAFKSPAPEIARSGDPSAFFYHEAEYAPTGADTLRILPLEEWRIPRWWRIREKWPTDQEISRLGQIAEIEILSGYAPQVADSVHAEILSVVAIESADWALWGERILWVLAAMFALISAILARRKLEQTGAVRESLLQGARNVNIPDAGQMARERVLAYIKEHYPESDLSLATLARQVGLSERAASTALRAATGQHFKGALNELRLAEACRLLTQGQNVSATAYAVGFNNPSHFTRAFRNRFGVAPSEWSPESVHQTRSEA